MCKKWMGRTLRMHTPIHTLSACPIFVEYAFRVEGLPTRPQTLFLYLGLSLIAVGNTDLSRFGVISWVDLSSADGTRPKAVNAYA